MKRDKVVRWSVRLLLLSMSFFLSFGGPLPQWTAKILPILSPYAVIANIVGQRALYTGLFWTLPPLLILLLAIQKGRYFCRWACPAGTLYALVPNRNKSTPLLKYRLNVIVFWATVSASLIGAPLLLFTDPLSSTNRLFSIASGVHDTAAIIPGLLIPVFLLLGLFQPMIWCSHICPLGYLFSLSSRKGRSYAERFSRDRRKILGGLVAGVPMALLAGRIPLWGSQKHPVLPPGAQRPDQYAGACSRCYACVQACPSGILSVPSSLSNRSPGQLCQPEMIAQNGACEEFCNACSLVCPTGAIHALSVDEKRHRQIGIAYVKRSACLAWADKEYCMVCDEFCPYNAIETIESPDGIPQPKVNPDICRGCGYCEHVCPAIRAGKAIFVEGVERQRVIRTG